MATTYQPTVLVIDGSALLTAVSSTQNSEFIPCWQLNSAMCRVTFSNNTITGKFRVLLKDASGNTLTSDQIEVTNSAIADGARYIGTSFEISLRGAYAVAIRLDEAIGGGENTTVFLGAN